jgi:hypothetical protein
MANLIIKTWRDEKSGVHYIASNVLMIDIDCPDEGHICKSSITSTSRKEAAERIADFARKENVPVIIYPTKGGVHGYVLDKLRCSRDPASILMMLKVKTDRLYVGFTLKNPSGLWNERISHKYVDGVKRPERAPTYGFLIGDPKDIHPECSKWLALRKGFIERRW